MNLDRGKVSSPVHTNGTFFVWSGNEYGIWTVRQIVFKSNILINELQVTSYELISLRVAFIATSCELRFIFIARVTSYFLHTSYELLFIARLTSYFIHTSYELLFIP